MIFLVLEVINETHIKIIALRNDRDDSYINGKGFHSIQLQIENLVIILHFNVDVVFFFVL